jgi:hypothetical protein
MSRSKILRVIIVIACIVVSGILAYVGYKYGYVEGNADGYSNEYELRGKEYEDIGYRVGWDSGCLIAIPVGYSDGYNSGWDLGEEYAVSVLCPKDYDHPPTDLYSPSYYYAKPVVDPTYSQLMSFLANDRTEYLDYSSEFNCWGFALELKRNAERQGIKCAIVSMSYEDRISGKPTSGHVINMFEVVDPPKQWTDHSGDMVGWWRLGSGDPIIYVDAQYGEPIYDIEVGGSYKWYTDFSELQREDNTYKGEYFEYYGPWGDLSGRVRASSAGVEYIEPSPSSRYVGNKDDIKRYMDGPFVKSKDNIKRMIVIW